MDFTFEITSNNISRLKKYSRNISRTLRNYPAGKRLQKFHPAAKNDPLGQKGCLHLQKSVLPLPLNVTGQRLYKFFRSVRGNMVKFQFRTFDHPAGMKKNKNFPFAGKGERYSGKSPCPYFDPASGGKRTGRKFEIEFLTAT